MRFSVVICTYNRAPSLRVTLDALRCQTYTDFEVVVVNGPSSDGTAALLAERAADLRVVENPDRNLSVSRNLGLDAAAGDIVAFVDDDGVPEPRWLADLAAAYDSDAVGAAGGLTLDNSGKRVQYHYAVCDRMGDTDFNQRPPLDEFNRPGADPFLYLQGTNCSFRRSVLVKLEGFDENIEYIYDDSEICSRVLDAGHELRALEHAVVHHHFLPSHTRHKGGLGDPCVPVKNRAYFALRAGRAFHSHADILYSLTSYTNLLKTWAGRERDRGAVTSRDLEHYLARIDEGFALGLEQGLTKARAGRPIAAADPGAFKPYPVQHAPGRKLSVAFVSLDYPPKPLGGIARFTQDLARGFAAAGHETHVVTRDDLQPERVDFEDGVWVHRFPVVDRFVPELGDHPLKGNLDHLAAVNSVVGEIRKRAPLDVVSSSLWIAEALFCALDPAQRVAVACNTPIAKVAELQPETAAAPITEHQARLEAALLRSPATLQPVSEENAALCRTITDRPMEVIWHGVADRRADFPRTRADDGMVEILFVGRQEPRKGIDTLLEAAEGLLRDHPHVRIRVCGADNPHANGRPGVFAERIAGMDRVALEEDVDDDALFAAYANADVFCGPSRYESFGLVHVEAMMMGLPVIGCDAGGMRETIVDGETGTLIAPGDAAALQAALEALVADPALRARQGAAGRARYEAEFGVDVAVARNADLYARMADAPAETGSQRDAVAALLVDLCGLEPGPAAEAAERLLDPERHPRDPEGEIRTAFAAEHGADFVSGLYRAVLDRTPDHEGVAGYVGRLPGEGRVAIMREIVGSDEAIAKGLSPRFADKLPGVDGRDLPPRIVAAGFADDDGAFAAELDRILCDGGAGPEARAAWERRLAEGAPRAEVVAEALRTPAARKYVGAPEQALVEELHSEGEVLAALRAAREPHEFVDTAYRLLLGRPADEEGLAAYSGLISNGVGRGVVLLELGSSAEAGMRGVPVPAVVSIARALSTKPVARRARARSQPDLTEARLLRAIERAGDKHSVEQRLQEVVDELRAERETSHKATTQLEAAIDETYRHVDVLARKYEAIAMDLRERLPEVERHMPEVDRAALEARVREVGGLRLNVGCGEKPLPGYVNVDFRPLPGVDLVADATSLPFGEGSVLELAAFHVVEHFRENFAATVLLPHWRSLLREDGMLRLVTPNWEVLIEQLRTGERTFAEFKQVTFGLQDYSGDDHYALYSTETLTDLLERAGFASVTVLAERRQNGLSPEIEVLARP